MGSGGKVGCGAPGTAAFKHRGAVGDRPEKTRKRSVRDLG